MHKNWQELTEEQQIDVIKLKKKIPKVIGYRYRSAMIKRFPKYKGREKEILNWIHFNTWSWEIFHDFETLIKEKEVKNVKSM